MSVITRSVSRPRNFPANLGTNVPPSPPASPPCIPAAPFSCRRGTLFAGPVAGVPNLAAPQLLVSAAASAAPRDPPRSVAHSLGTSPVDAFWGW